MKNKHATDQSNTLLKTNIIVPSAQSEGFASAQSGAKNIYVIQKHGDTRATNTLNVKKHFKKECLSLQSIFPHTKHFDMSPP